MKKPKTYTLKLTWEQLDVINHAVNDRYFKLYDNVQAAPTEDLKNRWQDRLDKVKEAANVIFEQAYEPYF